MKRYLLLSCFLSFSSPVFSVATDAAAYTQLVTLVKTTKEQLTEMRDTLNVTKQMANLQQSEFVQELTKAGEIYGEMFDDIRDIESQLEGIKNDPLGTKEIEEDIQRIQERMARANEMSGLSKAETYSSILRGLKSVEWLGKVQKKNEESLANGTDQRDSTEVGASAALTTSSVLLEKEKRELRERAINTQLMDDFMGGVDYGNMGLMQQSNN